MKFNTIVIALLSLCFSSFNFAEHSEQANPNEAIAQGWIKARIASKAENIAYVNKHFAEDGVIVAGRYVGFGFTFDPSDDGDMVVSRTIAGSPASKVLQVGDQFLVVNGVKVNEANLDRLSFRGKPGEPVKATIKRDSKIQDIEVTRGVISSTYSKAVVLDNINNADADEWSSKIKINEVLSKGDVVYVWSTVNDVDAKLGLPFEVHVVQRFVFNKDGLVTRVGSLSEDRFLLEQTGWTITR